MLEVDARFVYPGRGAANSAGVRAEFCVPAAAAAALMGASGAGKSTVVHLIAGLLRPTAGDIKFGRQNLVPLPPAARPLTCLLQTGNLFAHLTVWQNIGIGLRPSLRLDAAERRAVAAALEWVGLAGFEARKPPSLSGGQRQRVALARCFARDRPLLLLDEPFSGLDDDLRADMLGLIRRLQTERGATVLFATHRAGDAAALRAEIIEVRDGVAAQSPSAFTNPASASA